MEVVVKLGTILQGKPDWGLPLILIWLALPGMGTGAWALQNWSFLNGIDGGLLQAGFIIVCGILGFCVGAVLLLLLPFLGMAAGDPIEPTIGSIIASLVMWLMILGFFALPILGGVSLLSFIGVF